MNPESNLTVICPISLKKGRAGRLKDLADIARLSGITRARATQIMNLLHLAPDIQEKILFLPQTVDGRAPITERALRDIAAQTDWTVQRNRIKDVLDLLIRPQ